jgi:methionyl-tRNA formyltransferase
LSTVYLGTTGFAASILERLAASDAHRPSLVLTRPDRPRGRGRRLAAPPVAEAARALGLTLEQPASVNDPRVAERVAGLAPDAVVVCAFGALIKEPLLSQQEMLNVHPSLLPRWRGAAPIERAIMAGDRQTGVSILRLTAGLDSGPICLTGSEPIADEDTYGSLAGRLQELGGTLLLRALDLNLADGGLPFAEQQEQGVTYAEKIAPEDRLLDPGRTAAELERVVRALHPHIGARVALADGTLLGVQRAAIVEPEFAADAAADAGAGGDRVRSVDDRLLLDCSSGVLELLVVQPPGGRTMDASDYLRGRGLPGR